ncbi:MAG: cytochrome c [Elusimicrobia bacterium]|nr:cytochrome c [Elusimicrobiota bacterium]MBK7689065.1 cytochrome c [Elusimicrobiota bacterium]MBK8651109.1 cytochrome c [Elusimicrobiota bacterium]MBL0249347.1 cytochrome c [Elusimicrobiota bacterium]MBL0359538.1 cytochrome c [Elusimicrobiota bacterium]
MKILIIAGMAVVGLIGGVCAEEGQKLYQAKCQACHGPAGKGNPALKKVYGPGIDITDADTQLRDDADMKKIIQFGAVKGMMPAYRGRLKDEQITAIIAHVRSLSASDSGGPSLADE